MKGTRRLVSFAREVIRQHIQMKSEDTTTEEGMWDSFRVSDRQIAKQFRQEHEELFTEDLHSTIEQRKKKIRKCMENPPKDLVAISDLTALFSLLPEDLELLIMASGPALDPTLSALYSYAWNDIHKRCTDVGFICQVLAGNSHQEFNLLLKRLEYNAPLRKHRLLIVEDRKNNDDKFDLNLPSRRVRTADRVMDYLRYQKSSKIKVDEALASVCIRITKTIDFDELNVPEENKTQLKQIARSRTLPTILEGPIGSGKEEAATAIANTQGKGLLSADLTALLLDSPKILKIRLSELFREAKLGSDLLYLHGHSLPDQLIGPHLVVLKKALFAEPLLIGVDIITNWLLRSLKSVPIISVPLPNEDRRLKIWSDAFAGVRHAPDLNTLKIIVRRYQMSADQIREASREARRLARVARNSYITVTNLDKACRSHFAHQLSDLAQLVQPTEFKPAELILPEEEKRKFDEILLFGHEHKAIYSEWGFAEKYPYGRGLSVLFHGPPGTGKTMAATIIAAELGLDLFRIDLSRIISKWVGETEKNLARVFDEAERGRVMLLFDEADSLFTKRTEVRSSVDRYANLEVTYLLQRMENFDGLTVLTTNVETHLDDAFKRRIRYRIYFPQPKDKTRAMLWQVQIPKEAPIREGIPFDLLGETYDLSGGYIKKVVLRAAFYARQDSHKIMLKHLVSAAEAECRELGMLISVDKPKELAKHLKEEEAEQYPHK